MASLFNEHIQESTELKIVPKGPKVLTKNQNDFNKIIAKVQTLEKQLVSEEQKLRKFLSFYNDKIAPKNREHAEVKIEFAFLLNRTYKENKLSNKQIQNIKDLIVTLLDEAFCDVEPNKEQEDLFNSWSDLTYKEENEIQLKMEKEMFSTFMNTMGVDLDFKGLDLEDAESLAEFQAKMREQLKEKDFTKWEKKTKKQTKKQIEKESLLKAEEELKQKSLRSIYISLTKILHPDAEMDVALKQEKEAIMKELTNAYVNKDLPKLLKLELEWVHKTTEHLDQISDDKLKIYISVLRKRAKELEAEKYMLYMHPKYEPIEDITGRTEKEGLRFLEGDKKTLETQIELSRYNIETLQGLRDKKSITAFIDSMHTDMVFIDEDEEEDDFDFPFPF